MAERNYDFTEIKTRIIIRNDSAENWEGSTIVLEKGEPAIEYDAVNKTAKLKFGDGESTFSQLPFSTLTPSEVSSLISAVESGESSKVTTVTTSGDGNAVTGGSISDDGTTLTLTKGTEFVPASGGIFSGDVTVSGDLTADNVKTSGEISIIPTTNITFDSDGQEHDNSKITFVNTNQVTNETPISIEAKYTAVVLAGDHHAYDYKNLMINHVDDVGIDGRLNVKNSINGVNLTSEENYDSAYGGYSYIHSIIPEHDNPATIRLLRRNTDPGTRVSQIELNADNVVLSNDPTSDMHAATKKYVDDSVSGIVSAVDAMKFKGTIGTSGTVADIASISSPSTGDTYKIITATSLTSEQSFDGASHDLTVGDLVVYASNKWVFVPSGNEDVTTVKVADSGDTINVSTTAQTGALVLGTAAGVNTVSTVTDSATTVPTSSAVKTYVDTLENSLGTAAITDATAYATAAQGTLADNAMPKSGGTFTGDVTVSGELTTEDEITITSTGITEITTDGQKHSSTKINFCNANKGDGYNNEVSIEGYYIAEIAGSHVGDTSILKLNADSVETTEIDTDTIHASWISDLQVINQNDDYHFMTTLKEDCDGGSIDFITYHPAPNVYIPKINLNGAVTLAQAPTDNMHAATKKYVDDSVSSISTDSLIDGENILILNGGSATE